MNLSFTKMSGSGNDFIIIDDRAKRLDRNGLPELAKKLCRAKFSIGADGLIVIESSPGADFKWWFFNSDGSEAEMCGNGGRCAARFAYLKGMAPAKLSFETLSGIVRAEVLNERVKLSLSPPQHLHLNLEVEVGGSLVALHSLNTGVPHVVIPVTHLKEQEVVPLGREIRFHPVFAPAGTNVNFVEVEGPANLDVRTYERGVEDETLACGTGCVASAIILSLLGKVNPPISVRTRGGEILTVFFKKGEGASLIQDLYLEGDARLVYEGTLGPDALM